MSKHVRAFVAGYARVICLMVVILAALGQAAHAGSPPLFAILSVPEIDAGSAASALTLLVGTAWLLKEKFSVRNGD